MRRENDPLATERSSDFFVTIIGPCPCDSCGAYMSFCRIMWEWNDALRIEWLCNDCKHMLDETMYSHPSSERLISHYPSP